MLTDSPHFAHSIAPSVHRSFPLPGMWRHARLRAHRSGTSAQHAPLLIGWNAAAETLTGRSEAAGASCADSQAHWVCARQRRKWRVRDATWCCEPRRPASSSLWIIYCDASPYSCMDLRKVCDFQVPWKGVVSAVVCLRKRDNAFDWKVCRRQGKKFQKFPQNSKRSKKTVVGRLCCPDPRQR